MKKKLDEFNHLLKDVATSLDRCYEITKQLDTDSEDFKYDIGDMLISISLLQYQLFGIKTSLKPDILKNKEKIKGTFIN